MGMLVVGISDMKIAKVPDTLITYALGSCVGICLYDPVQKIAGLSHIMLPEGRLAPNDKSIAKFADTAIPELIRKMEQIGASRMRMKAKIAGGAQMFDIGGGNSNMWQIGERNVKSVTAMLQKFNIQIIAKDILLDYGRTVSFNPENGVMTVKAVNKPTRDL